MVEKPLFSRVRNLNANCKNIFFVAYIQKIQLTRVGFFHLCRQAQHHLRACTQHHLTVRSTSLPFAAQMNEVDALPQMTLQQVTKDAMLRINGVALRAYGAIAIRLDR